MNRTKREPIWFPILFVVVGVGYVVAFASNGDAWLAALFGVVLGAYVAMQAIVRWIVWPLLDMTEDEGSGYEQ
jgi:hypothetical protein